MPRVTFIQADGREDVVDVADDTSVMQSAMDNLVPGIIADCGGELTCATCHVYVDDQSPFQPPTAEEADMLECAVDPEPESRLSCQLNLRGETSTVVRVPASQL
ncbi:MULTISPECIES: 2Fe-2S iron-sulfur cluster-binding protein [Nocardiaceae]|uniref:2Fe-2S ferredoxin n=1 Tax=Rhodococcoides corynebacterioides TaxID=53972 RepID=A0ABS2L087_9NOCA|nr:MULTISPECIES: 2Fe-2S iron-sulfur cluster-binding protein [Rhodococcus]MBM7417456.1 2Fe-2S ferredoxin [Rhodococcus corynebacterioides]MBP1115710.1 2Fe-2S ferredoxin [Rhodococcus sp. PvP016]